MRPLVLATLLGALAACDRPAERPPTPAKQAYDADSAARYLLAPELASLLTVDTILDAAWLAHHAGTCRARRLPQIRHQARRINAPLDAGALTVFTRTTPDGEVRRVEVVRFSGRRPAIGATWDAATGTTTVTQWPTSGSGATRRTTARDPDAPLTAGLRYLGRRANAVPCDTVPQAR